MAKSRDGIPRKILINAALACMQKNGMPLEKMPSTGTSEVYKMKNGKTVNVRTCNMRRLPIIADSPKPESRLKIAKYDYVLFAMPEVQFTHGKILVYLVKTSVIAKAAEKEQRAWLERNPKTRGSAVTRVFRFHKHHKFSDYDKKWAKYLLPHEVFTYRH